MVVDCVSYTQTASVFEHAYNDVKLADEEADGNDKGLRGHNKKICKVRFNTDI